MVEGLLGKLKVLCLLCFLVAATEDVPCQDLQGRPVQTPEDQQQGAAPQLHSKPRSKN